MILILFHCSPFPTTYLFVRFCLYVLIRKDSMIICYDTATNYICVLFSTFLHPYLYVIWGYPVLVVLTSFIYDSNSWSVGWFNDKTGNSVQSVSYFIIKLFGHNEGTWYDSGTVIALNFYYIIKDCYIFAGYQLIVALCEILRYISHTKNEKMLGKLYKIQNNELVWINF